MLTTTMLTLACTAEQQRPISLPPEASSFPVVRNGSASTNLPEWRIADQPSLRIGTVDGELCAQLGNVTALTQLPGGKIVAAWGTTVRVFDSSGSCITTLGNTGSGPGEFSRAVAVSALGGDTVLLTQRLPDVTAHLYSIAKGYLGSNRITRDSLSRMGRAGEVAGVLAPLGGGRFLLKLASQVNQNYPDPVIRPRDSVTLTVLNSNFRSEGQLGRWLQATPITFVTPMGRSTGAFGTQGVRVSTTHAASDPQGDRVCVGDAIQPAVACFFRDGSGLSITWEAPRRPLPAAEIADRTLLADMSGIPGFPQNEYKKFLERIELPPHQPIFEALHMDSDFNLWVRTLDVAVDSGKHGYLVFGGDGRLLARAQIPAQMRTFEISGDHLLTTQRDSLGVNYIVKLPIEK
jgi:hypothetical protein